jgi:hypothetical protein
LFDEIKPRTLPKQEWKRKEAPKSSTAEPATSGQTVMPDGQTARAQEAHDLTEDQASPTTAPNSKHVEAGGQTVPAKGLTTPGDGQTMSPGGPTTSSYRTSTSNNADRTSSPITMEEDTDDDLLDYEPSPARDGMEINVIYLSSTNYSLLEEEEVSHLALGPQDAIFKKLTELGDHLKPLYIHGHLDGTPVACMLVDGGAAVNVMPYSTFKKLRKTDAELIKMNMNAHGHQRRWAHWS